MRDASEIDHTWLVELAPHFYVDNKKKLLEEKHLKEIESLK